MGRLKEQARGGSREIAKMAYTLSELQGLENDMDLGGIDVIDTEQPKIREVRLNRVVYGGYCRSAEEMRRD